MPIYRLVRIAFLRRDVKRRRGTPRFASYAVAKRKMTVPVEVGIHTHFGNRYCDRDLLRTRMGCDRRTLDRLIPACIKCDNVFFFFFLVLIIFNPRAEGSSHTSDVTSPYRRIRRNTNVITAGFLLRKLNFQLLKRTLCNTIIHRVIGNART